MIETDLTQELMELLKMRCQALTTLRHSDRFTRGIPDLSISNRRCQTVWVEMKRHTKLSESIFVSRAWIDAKSVVQLDTMVRVGGYYLVMDTVTNRYLYAEAAKVYHDFHHRVAFGQSNLDNYEFMITTINRREVYDRVALNLIKQLYPQGEPA